MRLSGSPVTNGGLKIYVFYALGLGLWLCGVDWHVRCDSVSVAIAGADVGATQATTRISTDTSTNSSFTHGNSRVMYDVIPATKSNGDVDATMTTSTTRSTSVAGVDVVVDMIKPLKAMPRALQIPAHPLVDVGGEGVAVGTETDTRYSI